MTTQVDMGSAFTPPDPKRQLSARIRASTLAKVKVIVAIWAERLRAKGNEDAADEVDTTYAIELLLAKAADDELAEWGGYPDTEAKLAAVLKQVRAASKQ